MAFERPHTMYSLASGAGKSPSGRVCAHKASECIFRVPIGSFYTKPIRHYEMPINNKSITAAQSIYTVFENDS